MNLAQDLTALWYKLTTWIKGAEQKLSPAIALAENVLNAIKDFEASEAGQTIEMIIETTIPDSTGLINAFKLQLPVWLWELNWLKYQSGQSLTGQWVEALQYFEKISDPDVKASQLNTLKALFTKWFAVNQGEHATIQQTLLLAQPTHDTSLITTA